MRVTRRNFLTVSISAGLSSRLEAVSVPADALPEVLFARVLTAYVDTLLPGDDGLPAASVFNIPQKVISLTEGHENYRRLVQWGCHWLETSAQNLHQKAFAESVEEDRVALIEHLERGQAQSWEWLFFDLTRRQSVQIYYAEPTVWAALGYPGPPQPAGFLDFDRPP